MGIYKPLILKKSPVVIVKNFIALQLASMAVFFLAGVAADYGEIYKGLYFADSVSYRVAEILFIFFFETVLVFYIFFSWYKEYYEFKTDRIVHAKGILFRHKNMIPLETVHAVSYRQGPLGKLTQYGTIELSTGAGRNTKLSYIPEPQKYVELITGFLKSKIMDKSVFGASNLGEMIANEENERLEFKSSFRWDLRQGKVNKNLEKSAMKTIAAFLNSDGGHLYIGVGDDQKVVGLKEDFNSLPKSNFDGFENHFTNVFHAMIGPEFRQYVRLTWHAFEGKDFCVIRVSPSTKPTYLRSEENEEFYIRTGNGTTSLRLSEAASYIDSHWQARLL
ncbi:MAG: hypothetical protein A2925_01605 [Candidatus Yanofskybacteria bacterium RIFCSPLOWO2_01_FULL_44_22]|uniref:Schlafen AlbA-2 domain-containing protein n=2 Tax=Candidatus Yanofskyibacteriota TaxID=1752733 RepID=A0A1F8GIQ0_9BACT|nr:MAG: transcriptional regulator [Candidatus Yanofskybacteria bacterium GW2011_GWA2_44_9]OGN05601.1 MAG: hypothetical protein A2659_04825 [Candidatus Yanofskybacteria bacterium RIFCSPHIGHO2_01_FULL_44_24]OGN25275.1 MAG: hypothetical protein A2925_01605 [Candidatus Yanofskybacteria bacterium RIFCSPLOWO2_01_FULL_44_22]